MRVGSLSRQSCTVFKTGTPDGDSRRGERKSLHSTRAGDSSDWAWPGAG